MYVCCMMYGSYSYIIHNRILARGLQIGMPRATGLTRGPRSRHVELHARVPTDMQMPFHGLICKYEVPEQR